MQAIRADKQALAQWQDERRLNMTKQRQDELTQRKRYTRKMVHDWVLRNQSVIAITACLIAAALMSFKQ